MKSWLYTLILISIPLLSRGQELFLHNESASTVPKGVLGVRIFGHSFSEINTQRNMLAIRLMYGVTPKLSVYLTATGSNHHGKYLPKDLVTHKHIGKQTIYFMQPVQKGARYPFLFNGLHAYGKYRFLTVDGQKKHFRMALYGEWSNVRNAHDETEPNLLDDTNGYGGGLITSYLKNRFAISLTSGVILPGMYEETVPHQNEVELTHTEIHYGRAMLYNLSLGYLLYPKEYKHYYQTNWNVYLEINGKAYEGARVFQDGNKLEVESPALKAAHYVEVHPGIQKIINSNLRIDLSVGFNMINRSYARFYPLYMIGVQRYFFFK